jgi:hypothetical protein
MQDEYSWINRGALKFKRKTASPLITFYPGQNIADSLERRSIGLNVRFPMNCPFPRVLLLQMASPGKCTPYFMR